MDNSESLDELPPKIRTIIRILKLPIRRENHLDTLQPLLKDINFFKQNKITSEDLRYICKKLKYEFIPAGFDVIKYGEYGNNFYITLHGSASVLIPGKKKKQETSKKMSYVEEVSESDEHKSEGDHDTAQPRSIRRITRRFTKMAHRKTTAHEQSQILNKTTHKNSLEVPIDEVTEEEDENYTEVSVLKGGSSFGELALISSKPRAATIRAKTGAYFAVIGKADYQKVLLKIQEKELNKKIDFFKSLPIFQDWTRIAVGKLTYFFIEKEYLRNFKVYSEGDKTEYIYIVLEGEFEANKLVTIGKKRSPEDNFIHEHISDKRQKPIAKIHKELIQNYAGSLSNSSSEASLDINNPIKENNGTENMFCPELFCRGSLIGDEDIYAERDFHTATVKCTSNRGKLFAILKSELIPRLQEKADSWELFGANALNKEIKLLKNVCTKETFLQNFQKLTENIKINKHLIHEYISFDTYTDLKIKPPQKLIDNILRCVQTSNDLHNQKIVDNAYHSHRQNKPKRVEYSQLREKKTPTPMTKIRKKTIDDNEIENFRLKSTKKTPLKERVTIPLQRVGNKTEEPVSSNHDRRSGDDLTEYSEKLDARNDNRLVMPSPPKNNKMKNPSYIIRAKNANYNISLKKQTVMQGRKGKSKSRRRKLNKKLRKLKKSRNMVHRIKTAKFIGEGDYNTLTKKSLMLDEYTNHGNSSARGKFDGNTTQNSNGCSILNLKFENNFNSFIKGNGECEGTDGSTLPTMQRNIPTNKKLISSGFFSTVGNRKLSPNAYNNQACLYKNSKPRRPSSAHEFYDIKETLKKKISKRRSKKNKLLKKLVKNDLNSLSAVKLETIANSPIKPPPIIPPRLQKSKRREPEWKKESDFNSKPETSKNKKKMLKILQNVLPLKKKVFQLKM
ncbi:unnamed protein product [Moneuplotes crassus]|uniref:Cyclic nucleotide-binding domain-containing protein n=1 Tax=Euplotes crassus TaxID=5936 RepID=A0AAD2D7D7_EUPCR|nr:unnamed protein product [Moneuplotes crassus]